MSVVVTATAVPSLTSWTLAPPTQSTVPFFSSATEPPMKHFA